MIFFGRWHRIAMGDECVNNLCAVGRLEWGRSLSGAGGLTRFAVLFASSERFTEQMPVMNDSGNTGKTAMILP